MSDKKIAADFIRRAQALKRKHRIKAYNQYEANVRKAVVAPIHIGRAEATG